MTVHEFRLNPAQVDALRYAAESEEIELYPEDERLPSRQTLVRHAWMDLGREMKFEWQTARPVPGKGREFFIAESHPPAPRVPVSGAQGRTRAEIEARISSAAGYLTAALHWQPSDADAAIEQERRGELVDLCVRYLHEFSEARHG